MAVVVCFVFAVSCLRFAVACGVSVVGCCSLFVVR